MDYLWGTIREVIEQGGHPSDDWLAIAIRVAGVPDDMLEYVAGRVDGRVVLLKGKGKGPPRQSQVEREMSEHNRVANTAFMVTLLEAAYRLQGVARPKTRAIESLATNWRMEPRTVRDRLSRVGKLPDYWKRGAKPGSPPVWKGVPSVEWAERMIESRTKTGEVRLSKSDGFNAPHLSKHEQAMGSAAAWRFDSLKRPPKPP